VQNLNRYGGKEFTRQSSKFEGPEQSEDVAPAAITVAEALRENGYATAHIGKYHVGGRDPKTLPENAGFDINIGGYSQGHQSTCFASEKNGDWVFKGLGRGDFDKYGAPYTKAYVKKYGLPESLIGTPKHVSDALGDAVEETISGFSKGDKPFYLQFHAYAVHGPVRARPDLKEAALKRDKELKGKTAEYIAFISSIDENLKRLLAAVEDPNQDGDTSDSLTDNTLILFTSDNGGTHADNLPLRGNKGMLTEGGMRVPLIAYWPGVVPSGTVTDHLVHSVDYYPTYLDLAGKKWMPDADEHPLDGESFAHILRKPDAKPARGPIYFLFPGYMDTRAQPTVVAIDEVQGKRYKLFYFYEADAWELYCLSDDIGEANNIIASMPELATSMSKKMHAWLGQKHPTWQPKYPIDKKTGKPAGPPKRL
jgi:arylsulfatase A-like enzyme